ncbi:hypothetical protein ACFQZF_01745 [Flavobacterium myungsuense]|uniref:Uncharacterized protein n=1 Tax=Flavobacterium myungsuense TaxID=651823 RepID=A0ABW3J0J7_9FLAO
MCTKVRNEELEDRSKKRKIVFFAFLLFSVFYSFTTNAQCAMCRAAIESEGDTAKAQAVNDGIVYLMAIPYLLVAAIGYAVYRLYSKKKV